MTTSLHSFHNSGRRLRHTGSRRRRMGRGVRSITGAAFIAMAAVGCGGSTSGGADQTTTASGGDAGNGGQSEATPGATEVTLVLDWAPNTNHAGIYLAEANGWYEEADIDLNIVQPGANGGLQALAGGDAEFAISVQEELTPARAAGIPVVSIAAIIEHNTSSLLSLADRDISRPSALAGRRYGGWGGQLEDAIIDALVECDGGDPEQVEFVSVGDADYRVGLENGDYDTVWVFDGWDKIRFEQAGVAIDTIEFQEYAECIPDWYTPLLATSEGLIADDPALVERFVEVTSRGYQEAMSDPAAAANALLDAAPELDRDLVTASSEYLAGQYAADPAKWGYQDDMVWQEFTKFLDDADMLTASVDPADAYTNDFIDAANE